MLELYMCAHSTGAGGIRRARLLLQHVALYSGLPTSERLVLQQSKTIDTFVDVALGLVTDSANSEVTGKAGSKHWDAVAID